MRWPWIAAAALAGGALLAWLFPRYENGARYWSLAVSREQAINTAIELTGQNGLDINNWHFSVGASFSPQRLALRPQLPATAAGGITPVVVTVRALSPGGDRSAGVDLDSNGQLLRYFSRGAPGSGGDASAQAAAERMFRRLAADRASDYRPVSRGATATGGAAFTWEQASAPEATRRFRIKIDTAGGRVVSASREMETGAATNSAAGQPSRSSGPLLSSLAAITATLAISVACWIFFSRLGRRTRHVRLASRVALAVAVCVAVTFLTGNRTDAIVTNALEGNVAFGAMLPNVIFGTAMLVLLWLIAFGAGFALLPEALRPQWLGAGALARREWLSRRVGQESLAGLLLGLPLACLPYFLPATGLFPEMRAEIITPRMLLARAPWASSLTDLLLSVDALALVALWLPVGARWLPRRWQWTLAAMAVTVPLSASFHSDYWSGDLPRVIEAVLLPVAYLLIVRLSGVIGLGAAIVSAYATIQGLLFLSQPSAALAGAGKLTFVRLAAVAATVALLAWKGRPLNEAATLEELDPAREDEFRTEHERLLGEFTVARKAQEGMLPDRPPEIPGYELVGLCRPALEVGGDLYDFQRLPDGRLLFCVADVSGKGVTAALYMTLTKGLLAALSRHYIHASEIITELNRHLYAECRRRTFVTMVLGVLDPTTGALELVRAGHNPAILCRPTTHETRDIQPRGLGLALTGAGSFRAQLDAYRLRLEPGDCLLFYSDGLPETMNPVKEQYGEERIRKVAAQSAGRSAAEFKDALLESVDRFRSGADAHDDLTLLIVRALPA